MLRVCSIKFFRVFDNTYYCCFYFFAPTLARLLCSLCLERKRSLSFFLVRCCVPQTSGACNYFCRVLWFNINFVLEAHSPL